MLLPHTHLQVVSVGHSSLNFDGQPLRGGEERLVILVRDRPQKAFFIKVVDPLVIPHLLLVCEIQ